jgi:putative ABC transport system ATP-binding protein
MLELDGVVKSYRSGDEELRAVNGVSLRVGAGEIVAIQGPSGSGKTTLLMLIAALLRADEGIIRFDERDLATFSEQEVSDYLMREVGFIYQSYRLMPRVSSLENAALKLLMGGFGARDAQERARPWLERLGLGQRLRHTPEQLSGGERQRVAIARALAGEPRLILADEPTGNLDSTRSVETIGLLAELAHERQAAVVLVTHDPEAAALADRRYLLRDGALSEAPETVAGDGGARLSPGFSPGVPTAGG